jgi:cell division protein FtsB
VKAPRILALALGSVVLSGVLFLFVLPGRTYLDQQRSLAAADTRLRVLSNENGKLQQQIQHLQTDAEIERIARQQYGLVKPGEQAYAILPAAETTPAPPPPASAHRGTWYRLWHAVQFWH